LSTIGITGKVGHDLNGYAGSSWQPQPATIAIHNQQRRFQQCWHGSATNSQQWRDSRAAIPHRSTPDLPVARRPRTQSKLAATGRRR